MDWQAFFTVHQDLPREGPGTAEEVAWACNLAGLPSDAAICDAGAGTGGDIAALLQAAPAGRVLAVEAQQSFVAEMAARFADATRVTVAQGDMARLQDFEEAPFDLIWCAGALYFLGIEDGLAAFAKALKPRGVVAFSEPCLFTATPSDAALAFWDGYATRTMDGITAAVERAGYTVLGQRPVSDAGWEAYYQPMEARIARLRPDADGRLTEMLDLCAQEAAQWRQVRAETGYLLTVARLT